MDVMQLFVKYCTKNLYNLDFGSFVDFLIFFQNHPKSNQKVSIC